MSRSELLLWVIVPYACLVTFALGHVWRYRRDQFNWTTRSTQILERKMLRQGIILFHVGLLMVVGGHVLGLVIPRGLTAEVGVTDDIYHWVSVVMGTIAGLVMTAGFAILMFRRLRVPRVAQGTTNSDLVIFGLLTFTVVTGMLATIGINLISGGYHYRETVSPWFRGIFMLNPDGSLMSDAPLVYQLHALSAMLVFAVWPFSRLVHAWSVPLTYFGRSPILYRSQASSSTSDRSAPPAQPATRHGGRRNGSIPLRARAVKPQAATSGSEREAESVPQIQGSSK